MSLLLCIYVGASPRQAAKAVEVVAFMFNGLLGGAAQNFVMSDFSLIIDQALGQRCRSIIGYQYSEIVRSLMSVYFCGGSCVEDVVYIL